MVKLTERLVLARSRASDLENVRKLNCWASELTDVSVIRKMVNVQIVSLSVNHLSTMSDFIESQNLEELYIRKNDIKQLEEIWHLRKLPRLRVLWLADNPCAESEKYRMTVLKTLPNLQRLDNVPVTEEEVNEAIIQGVDLEPLFLQKLKNDPPPSLEKNSITDQENGENGVDKNIKEKKLLVEHSLSVEMKVNKILELENCVTEEKKESESKESFNHKLNDKDDTSESCQETVSTPDSESSIDHSVSIKTGTDDTTPGETTDEKVISTPNLARVDMSEEEEEKEEGELAQEGDDKGATKEKESDNESLEEGEILEENTFKETNEIRQTFGMRPVPEKSIQPSLPRSSYRTTLRNSNILSAVLSLIKELDDDSLDMVSDAIRDKLESR